MTLPLQILFWIDSASLKSGRYRDTISDYSRQLRFSDAIGFNRPLAYITLTDAEKPLLADCVDHCYEHDVRPIAQDGTQVKERGQTDLQFCLDRQELQQVPFTLFVKADTRIQPANGNALFDILRAAVQTLHSNHHVVSVGFQGSFNLFPPQQVSDMFNLAQVVKYPVVLRSRDLWLAALLAGQQQPMEQVLSAFSYSQIRNLAFHSNVATAL